MTSEPMSLLIGSALRATVVLGFAWGLTSLMRRASAATRHFLWTCAIAGAALLPATAVVMPPWGVPSPAALAPLASVIVPAAPDAAPPDQPPVAAHGRTTTPQTAPGREPAPLAPSTTGPSRGASYAGVAMTVWAAGTIAVLIYMLAGLLAARRIRRSAVYLDTPWVDEAHALAEAFEIRSPIAIVESARVSMPLVCGYWRPLIVMPQGAGRWPQERLHVVLLHELAHIKRRDCLTQALAQCVCAAYWFTPLVWVAARRLRAERERACDDFVLAAGTKGSEYASHLLEMARAMGKGSLPTLAGAGLPMAHRSQLEGRLMAILDPAVRRSSAFYARLAAVAAVLLVSIPVAAVQLRPSAMAPPDIPVATIMPGAPLPAAGGSAPADQLQWSGDRLQWSGTVAQGKTFQIQIQKRGVYGSIRAIGSEDDRIHVDARRNDDTDVDIELAEHDRGTAICVGECQLRGRETDVQNNRFVQRLGDLFGRRDVRVDFVVRVPAGVHFAGSTLDGDIGIEGVRADVRAATINGDVTIHTTGFAARATTIDGDVVFELPAGADADFRANTIHGTIDADFPLLLNAGRLPAAPRAPPLARPFLPDGGPFPGGRDGRPPQIVNAIIGNGGPALRANTIDGDIRVRRR